MIDLLMLSDVLPKGEVTAGDAATSEEQVLFGELLDKVVSSLMPVRAPGDKHVIRADAPPMEDVKLASVPPRESIPGAPSEPVDGRATPAAGTIEPDIEMNQMSRPLLHVAERERPATPGMDAPVHDPEVLPLPARTSEAREDVEHGDVTEARRTPLGVPVADGDVPAETLATIVKGEPIREAALDRPVVDLPDTNSVALTDVEEPEVVEPVTTRPSIIQTEQPTGSVAALIGEPAQEVEPSDGAPALRHTEPADENLKQEVARRAETIPRSPSRPMETLNLRSGPVEVQREADRLPVEAWISLEEIREEPAATQHERLTPVVATEPAESARPAASERPATDARRVTVEQPMPLTVTPAPGQEPLSEAEPAIPAPPVKRQGPTVGPPSVESEAEALPLAARVRQDPATNFELGDRAPVVQTPTAREHRAEMMTEYADHRSLAEEPVPTRGDRQPSTAKEMVAQTDRQLHPTANPRPASVPREVDGVSAPFRQPGAGAELMVQEEPELPHRSLDAQRPARPELNPSATRMMAELSRAGGTTNRSRRATETVVPVEKMETQLEPALPVARSPRRGEAAGSERVPIEVLEPRRPAEHREDRRPLRPAASTASASPQLGSETNVPVPPTSQVPDVRSSASPTGLIRGAAGVQAHAVDVPEPEVAPLSRTAVVSVTDAAGHSARIRVTVIGDQVVTRLHHSDADVARVIAGRSDDLRSTLANLGFESSLSVHAGGAAISRAEERAPWQEAQSRTPDRSDEDARERESREQTRRDPDRQQSQEQFGRERRPRERWFVR